MGVRTLAVAAVFTAVALTGCGSEPPPDDQQPVRPSANIVDALTVVPASAERVVVRDVGGVKERAGFGDVTSESPVADQQDYFARAAGSPHAQSVLTGSRQQMRGWGWNAADVVWEVDLPDWSATIIQLRDDLDMDTVVESFQHRRYDRTEDDSALYFTLADDSAEPAGVLGTVGVVPGKSLVVTGRAPQGVAAEVARGGTVMGYEETVRRLVERVDVQRTEYASIRVGASACVSTDDLAGVRAPGTFLAAVAPLPQVDGSLIAIAAADDASVDVSMVTALPDDESAAADASARTAFLEEGHSTAYDAPYSQVVQVDAVDVDRTVVEYDLGGDMAEKVRTMINNADEPWSFCGKG
ncbi:MAG: hypothetical protein GEU96_13160 [Propionibacteriales bacterium]|nr:hypothetical protein [Propionibacteriales bacterium]